MSEPSDDQKAAWKRAAEAAGDKPWWWNKPWSELSYQVHHDVQAWFQNRDPQRRAVEPRGSDLYVKRHCDPRPHMNDPSTPNDEATDEPFIHSSTPYDE